MTESQFLAALTARANARGIVLASEETLLHDLGIGSDALRKLLNESKTFGAIEVLSSLPFLVAKLPGSWPGRRLDSPRMAAKTAAPASRAYSFQSSRSQSKLLMKESYRQPAGEDALLQEILVTLGETDPTTFRGAVKNYAPAVIRRTLDRVRRNPAIFRSKAAASRACTSRWSSSPRIRRPC